MKRVNILLEYFILYSHDGVDLYYDRFTHNTYNYIPLYHLDSVYNERECKILREVLYNHDDHIIYNYEGE